MRTSRQPLVILLPIVVALASGCNYSPDIVTRTMAFNRAVAESTDEMLLLNIIRASQRYPTYYSRLGANNAIGSLSSEVGLSIPIGRENAFSSAVDGLTREWTSAAWSMAPKVSTSESNQLALQALDDQKYINGMMAPIALEKYRLFLDAGWRQEFLLLLLVQKVQISREFGTAFVEHLAARCGRTAPGQNGGAVTAGLAPSPALDRFCRTEDTSRLEQCLKSSDDPIIFHNDPAQAVSLAPSRPHVHDPDRPIGSQCFQAALRGLLALGLSPSEPTQPVALLQPKVPLKLASEPEFMEAAITNQWLLADRMGSMAVCSVSKPEGTTLQLSRWESGDAAGCGAAPEPTPGRATRRGSKTWGAGSKKLDECRRLAEGSEGETSGLAKRVGSTDGEPVPSCPVASQGTAGSYSFSVPQGTLTLTLRSTEGVVYFLGQNARAQTELGRRGVTLIEEELDGGPAREVDVFLVQKDGGCGASVSTTFGDSTYSIPTFGASYDSRSGAPSCSTAEATIQRPANRSLEALKFVSQLWGLQKESSSAPIPAAVTVIAP